MKPSALLSPRFPISAFNLGVVLIVTTLSQQINASPVSSATPVQSEVYALAATLRAATTAATPTSTPLIPSNMPSVEDGCVFYTSKLKQTAVNYAKNNEKTTIWDIYPSDKYDMTISPLKDWNDRLRRILFQRTSRAFAHSCSGKAWVVIPHGRDPCSDSIWLTDEFDAVEMGETGIDIDNIMRLDEDGNEDGNFEKPSSGGKTDLHRRDESCPEPTFTGDDPENYWGN